MNPAPVNSAPVNPAPVTAVRDRRLLPALLVLALVVALVASWPASAQTVDHPGPVLDEPALDLPQFRGEAGDKSDEVRAVAQAGRWVVVGGSFRTVTAGGATTSQPRLAAYDRRTGALHADFAPQLDGRVRGLAADGPDHVLVGGEFQTVDGVRQPRLARIELRDGSLDRSFRPDVSAFVNDIVVADGRVVFGGTFTEVGGEPRLRLAAVRRSDGALDPSFRFDVTEEHGRAVGVRSVSVTPDGDDLLVVHTGRRVNDEPRIGAAVISLGDEPELRDWRTRQYEPNCRPWRGDDGFPWMRDADISPDGRWAVVMSGNGNYPPACDTATRFQLTDLDDDDVEATWISALFDTPEAVAVSDEAVYVGGHFESVMGPGTTYEDYPEGNNTKNPPGSIDRFQLAALSIEDGTGLPDWQANANGLRGVLALAVTPHGLLAGSDGTLWARNDLGAHAFFPAVARDGAVGPATGEVDVGGPRGRLWGAGR